MQNVKIKIYKIIISVLNPLAVDRMQYFKESHLSLLFSIVTTEDLHVMEAWRPTF
jgi:hypothetical protein